MNRATQRRWSGMAGRGWLSQGQVAATTYTLTIGDMDSIHGQRQFFPAHDDRHAAVLAVQRLGCIERVENAVLQCGVRVVEGFERLALETMTIATGGQAR